MIPVALYPPSRVAVSVNVVLSELPSTIVVGFGCVESVGLAALTTVRSFGLLLSLTDRLLASPL